MLETMHADVLDYDRAYLLDELDIDATMIDTVLDYAEICININAIHKTITPYEIETGNEETGETVKLEEE